MEENKVNTEELKPAESLKETTNDLIKDSLSHAKDESKPWYERVSYYVGAAVLVVLYYIGSQYGSDLIETIIKLF